VVDMGYEFQLIYRKIVQARCPEDIFGDFSSKGTEAQKDALEEQYQYLTGKVNPANFSGDRKLEYMAGEAKTALDDYYKKARILIGGSSYGLREESPGLVDIAMSFNSEGKEYKIYSDMIEGDFSNVYFGEMMEGERLEHICLKVPYDKKDNNLMRNEAAILKDVQHKSLPVLLDELTLDGKRCNVTRTLEKSYDLYEVKEKYPDGLPQEHVAWVFDRLLSVLGFLHTNRVIHGSIEPGNIMITPHNHNGLLIDYMLGIPDANRSGKGYKGMNDYSAPEVKKGVKPYPTSDMYSLGKSMLYLAGGDMETNEFPSSMDTRFADFIKGLLREDVEAREKDAWSAWHRWRALRREVLGEPEFRELRM